MFMRKVFFLYLLIIMGFTACNDGNVKILDDNFLDTKLGTMENQKLITSLPKKITVEPKKAVKKLTVSEKKKRFKEILIPISQQVYTKLEQQYQDIKEDIKNNENREYIELLKKEYKAKTDETLLYALKPHPISITLAQAAAESAWLTSRFTKEAYNIFGVWSFNKNEPRIAASGLRGTKTIYLKKYKSYKEAVEDYYKNIGRNWAYAEFRKQRTLTNDPYELASHLGSYSEKKEAYTKLLQSMIKYNEFHKHDIQEELK